MLVRKMLNQTFRRRKKIKKQQTHPKNYLV